MNNEFDNKLEISKNITLEDGTKITPKEIADSLNNLLENTKNKTVSKERRIYLEAYYRSKIVKLNKKIEIETTPREQQSNESDKEYKIYLNEYFNVTLKRNTKFFPGTAIAIPRIKREQESEQNYKDYLETYYKMVFPNKKIDLEEINKEVKKIESGITEDKSDEIIDILNESKYEKTNQKDTQKVEMPSKEKPKKVTKRIKTAIKKTIQATLFAGALLLATMGLGGHNKKDINNSPNNNYSIEYETDKQLDSTTNNIANDYNNYVDEDTMNQIDLMLNETNDKISTPTVGDIINIKNGVNYYYDSLGSNPVGTVGNEYTKEGNYIVDALSIVNKNNEAVAVTYDGGMSLEKLSELYNIDLTSEEFKINYHFSDNETLELKHGTANQKGWVAYDQNNYDKQSNIIENERSK